MKKLILEGPLWRRTLTVCGAMIGACTVFVSLVLVLLGTALDSATSASASDNNGRASMQDSSDRSTIGSAKKKAPASNNDKSSARTNKKPTANT